MKITKANLMRYMKLNECQAKTMLHILNTPLESSVLDNSDMVDWKLDKLNEFLQGYGVEALTSEFA